MGMREPTTLAWGRSTVPVPIRAAIGCVLGERLNWQMIANGLHPARVQTPVVLRTHTKLQNEFQRNALQTHNTCALEVCIAPGNALT